MIIIVWFFLLLSSYQLSATNNVTPFIITRSQSSSAPRNIVGTLEVISAFDSLDHPANFDGFVALVPEYQHSFRSDRITQCLFGPDLISPDDCPRLVMSGSKVKNRGHQDWLADYFGLPPDFQSIVEFRPVIKEFIFDVDLFFRWKEKLALFVSIPFVHTRRSLGISETVVSPGVLGYTAGYSSPEAVARDQLVCQFSSFISGCQLPELNQVVFEPLCFGKMADGFITQNDIADIQVILVADLITKEHLSFAVDVRTAISTGTTPSGEFLFEPIAGNGDHWELGAGATLGYRFWTNDCHDSSVSCFVDLQLTHLFAATQCRSFDLCTSANSRYMLAQKMGEPIEDNLEGALNGTPTAQFKNKFTTVVNLTTIPVETKHTLQAELTAFVHYMYRNWELDIGYNMWALSCEQIEKKKDCPLSINDGWALKGDSYLFGFDAQNNFEPVALSSTQQCATIHGGNNFPGSAPFVGIPDVTEIIFSDQNPGVDNAQTALGNTMGGAAQPLVTSPGSMRTINTSVQPLLLSDKLIDICSAQARGLSHSIFAHISYRWHCYENYTFFLGAGGQVEFVPREGNPECSCCPNCAVTQAAVWIKGGINFD